MRRARSASSVITASRPTTGLATRALPRESRTDRAGASRLSRDAHRSRQVVLDHTTAREIDSHGGSVRGNCWKRGGMHGYGSLWSTETSDWCLLVQGRDASGANWLKHRTVSARISLAPWKLSLGDASHLLCDRGREELA